MKKLLFISPHLSTGGQPQYLYKQIESLLNDYEIYCIEWENVTGGVLVVQRNLIEKLLGNRLISLGEDKSKILSQIAGINPNIIHFQEIPEYFMPYDIAVRIYKSDRRYKIIETSHDSGFNIDGKLHFPDRFLMVSDYQVNKFKVLGIPTELVEYPIETKRKTRNREEILTGLGLDPNLKHVINVGLFTPRKNQAEIIEYAKELKGYPIQFHFIGNQADNFKHYWEPIMQDFPPNCKWWGERKDVDTFYEMADLFLFTSRGHQTDKETMPLVIREAIGWNIPSLIYNLDVYLGYFDKYKNIQYLDFNDLGINSKKIIDSLDIKTKTPTKNMEIKNYEFQAEWNADEQKMYYSCNTDIDSPIIVSLREYQSDGILWSMTYDKLSANIWFWMSPVPKSSYDLDRDENFTGIKICIYKKDTNEQIYEKPFYKRFKNKPNVRLSNFIPYRLNYEEYFIQKKYDKWLSKQYDLVVDVGANVGVFTQYMILNGWAKNILAVECDSLALKDLNENFKLNDRVDIIPKALHHKNEPIELFESEANPVITSTLAPEKLENHMAGVKGDTVKMVETITIKDIVEAYETIDLLKIDIEGAEYEILLNTPSECFESINNIFLECHFFENDSSIKYKTLIEKLSQLGYKVEEFENGLDKKCIGGSECIFAKK
jgi:FkbM family methyltransferase